jgi:hypothetical protein
MSPFDVRRRNKVLVEVASGNVMVGLQGWGDGRESPANCGKTSRSVDVGCVMKSPTECPYTGNVMNNYMPFDGMYTLVAVHTYLKLIQWDKDIVSFS